MSNGNSIQAQSQPQYIQQLTLAEQNELRGLYQQAEVVPKNWTGC